MKFTAALSLFLLAPSVVNGFAPNQVKTLAVDSLKSSPFGNFEPMPGNGRPMEGPMEGRPMQRSRTMVCFEIIVQ